MHRKMNCPHRAVTATNEQTRRLNALHHEISRSQTTLSHPFYNMRFPTIEIPFVKLSNSSKNNSTNWNGASRLDTNVSLPLTTLSHRTPTRNSSQTYQKSTRQSSSNYALGTLYSTTISIAFRKPTVQIANAATTEKPSYTTYSIAHAMGGSVDSSNPGLASLTCT
jgi:hypothetical protein